MNTDTLSQLSDRDWAMYIRALIRPTPEDELKVKTYRKELLQGCLEDAESDVKQRDCQIKALQEENTEIRQRIRLFQEQLVVCCICRAATAFSPIDRSAVQTLLMSA